jgi:hypothetical protein
MITGRIKKLEDEANSLRVKFRIVFVILSILAVANLGQILYTQFSSVKNQLTDNTISKSVITENKPKITSKGDYTASINSFYNNIAITGLGYQLELKKNSVSTKGTTNCYTPTPPPIANGCGFEIRPYAASIPIEGTRLLNIIFDAKIGQNDKIVVDLKDSNTGEITSNLGKIEGRFKELATRLPPNFKKNEQILIRLWPESGSEITVNEIFFEYLDINKLQTAELKLTPEDTKKYTGKKSEIYLDTDKNGSFDKNTDILWNCKDGFSGVKPTTIKEDGLIKLERDDSCIKDNLPSGWKTDGGYSTLNPYYWLLVINDDSSNKTYPFQVVKDKTNYDL